MNAVYRRHNARLRNTVPRISHAPVLDRCTGRAGWRVCQSGRKKAVQQMTAMQSSYEEVLRQVSELCLREPDETKPYEFKYAAAELCKEGAEKAGGKPLADILASPPGGAEADQLYTMLARRGLVLMETDLLADAQSCVEAALKHLQADEVQNLALLLECHNALGALQSGRDDLDNALACLQNSYDLYMRHRHPGQGTPEQEPSHAAAAQVSSGAQPSQGTWDDVERQHTSTLFFLAQVHGHAKRKELSAKFCAATLQRQLESGEFQLHEWLQNCMQLSGYYVSCNAFAVAQYCLLAAAQVSEKVTKGLLLPVNLKALGAQQQQQEQQSEQQQEQQEAGQQEAGSGREKDAEASNVVQPQEQQQQQQLQEQQQQGQAVEATRVVLEPDVAANLELAWAKLHLGRLVASHEHFIDGLEPKAPYPAAEQYADLIIFNCLELPPLSSLPWGQEVLVSTFEQARDVFNAAMLHFKTALEYYVLDGWVTEHCNIQMEISNMYRCLASFETETKRKRLMHQQRVQRLQPLHGTLNPEFFLGLVRSIALELGNVSRDVMELEEKEGRPAAKVTATRKDAMRYYQDFMDTFRDPIGPNGVLPDRIPDEANERYFLLASFGLGRVMSGRLADRDMEPMAKACDLLRWTADYVKRHEVAQFEREAKMSLELVALITEKMELTKRLAAGTK